MKSAEVIVDSHHHFWDPIRAEYPWMTGEYLQLSRPFEPDDLSPLIEAAGVSVTVVVQARQEIAETTSLLEIASATPWVVGVVGWVDLTAQDVELTLGQLLDGPAGQLLVGIRHLVHDEPDPEWLLRDDVVRGLRAVASAGLAFDLLVRTREMPAATEVARRVPELRFVLDHIAKPAIATGEMRPWARQLRALASKENVTCKVSGLVTEASWDSWRPEDLRPYVEVAAESFGPNRLMWGSDWPVCTLAATYGEVFATSKILLEQALVDTTPALGRCAIETYRLQV
jgi:L-fuconolactonase